MILTKDELNKMFMGALKVSAHNLYQCTGYRYYRETVLRFLNEKTYYNLSNTEDYKEVRKGFILVLDNALIKMKNFLGYEYENENRIIENEYIEYIKELSTNIEKIKSKTFRIYKPYKNKITRATYKVTKKYKDAIKIRIGIELEKLQNETIKEFCCNATEINKENIDIVFIEFYKILCEVWGIKY